MSEASLQAVTDIVILKPWLGAAPASVFLQCVGLVRLRGGLHSITVMVMVVTLAMFGLAAGAYYMDPGNLWQLLLIISTPPLFVVTLGLLLMGMIAGRPEETRTYGHY